MKVCTYLPNGLLQQKNLQKKLVLKNHPYFFFAFFLPVKLWIIQFLVSSRETYHQKCSFYSPPFKKRRPT